jgi:hypothetical protein
MPTLRRELTLAASADVVWDAFRDFANVHTRVAPGFVVACQWDGDARQVTFANGSQARELLVTCDDATRRLVYAVASPRLKHYSAAVDVVPTGDAACRVLWTVDVAPAEVAPYVEAQMGEAVRAMRKALGGT